MGTWGPGNLDSDYAMEELCDRVSQLVGSMLERANSPTSREWDEYDYTTLFVEIELLLALARAGLVQQGELPSEEDVLKLMRDYFAEWDNNMGKEAETQTEFWRERRGVMKRTFMKLARTCRGLDAPQ